MTDPMRCFDAVRMLKYMGERFWNELDTHAIIREAQKAAMAEAMEDFRMSLVWEQV